MIIIINVKRINSKFYKYEKYKISENFNRFCQKAITIIKSKERFSWFEIKEMWKIKFHKIIMKFVKKKKKNC